jgi:hypothetical protein
MKITFTLCLVFAMLSAAAQVDTVVVRPDSTFESLFHRKLYDQRTNIRYHLDERGYIRDIVIYLATLEELKTGRRMYAVRVDQRLNRSIFTDAPLTNAEYIDEDELPEFIGYLDRVRKDIMSTPHNNERYTEYRFYTRAGIMLECYTGLNRWRCLLHYEISKIPTDTYINNPERLEDLIGVLQRIQDEIKLYRKQEKPS